MTQNRENQNEEQGQEKGIVLTPEALERMISTAVTSAVAAMKAPTPTEQKKLDAEEKELQKKQEDRLKMASSVKDDIERKKQTQRICSHEHADGNSHCVYVQERVGPGYLICQKNQCIIRPGEPSGNYKGTVIYNTELFNKIFQKLRSLSGDIFG